MNLDKVKPRQIVNINNYGKSKELLRSTESEEQFYKRNQKTIIKIDQNPIMNEISIEGTNTIWEMQNQHFILPKIIMNPLKSYDYTSYRK